MKIQNLSHQGATGLLVLTAALWSLGGVLIKSVDASPLAIASLRSGIAALVFLAFMRRPRFVWTGAQWGAALSFAATVTLFVCATKLTTAANAILLQYTAPLWAALFSRYFLGEKITRLDVLSLGGVLLGMALFFAEKLSASHFWGNLLALASGLSFAWIALFLRKQKGESIMESIFLGNVITFLLGIPFFSSFHRGAQLPWLAMSVLGIFQLGLPYVLYSQAISHVSALEGTLIPVLEPILNPLWVLLFFGERPSLFAVAGGLVVLSSMTGRGVLEARRASRPVQIPSPD